MIGMDLVHNLALPPLQYDYTPTRAYVVQYVSVEELKKFCVEPEGYTLVGCTVLRGYVLVRNDMTTAAKRHVLRHELGHVNGWEHD